MPISFLDSGPRSPALGRAFARSSMLALLGLLAGPVLLTLASAIGHPLREGAAAVYWLGAIAGFAGAAVVASGDLALDARRTCVLAIGFVVAGVIVAGHYRLLTGLTGRESILAVTGSTLAAFAAGFSVAGVFAARAVHGTWPGRPDVAGYAAAGVIGGAWALLPFWWSVAGLHPPGEAMLVTAIGGIGFVGSVAHPFFRIGRALEPGR